MRRFLTGIIFPALILGVFCAPLSSLAAEGDAEPRKPGEELNGDQQETVSSPESSAKENKSPTRSNPAGKADIAGNPFAIHRPADSSEEFVPASDDRIPHGIRVVAILVVKGREPLAVLSLPGSAHLHYVRKGELIQVDDQRPAGKSRIEDKQSDQRGSPVYLLVKSVDAKQVEIAPRTRPQDARILR